MSGWAIAFFIALAWIIGRSLRRQRRWVKALGAWVPRRFVCAFRRHLWGLGSTVKVAPDTSRSYFAEFQYRCLRCNLVKRVRLNPPADSPPASADDYGHVCRRDDVAG